MILAAIVALADAEFPLEIKSIMRGYELIGHAPRNLKWADDGQSLTFSWAKTDGTPDPKYIDYKVDRDGTGLSTATRPPLVRSPRDTPPTQTSVRVQSGDLYYFNAATKENKRLTNTPEAESDPLLTDDGKAVVYTISPNLYRLQIADGSRVQLTDVQTGSSETNPALTSSAPYVVRVPTGYRPRPFVVSPKGGHAWIEYWEEVDRGRRADVPNYVTTSGYPEMIPTFERVGARQAQSKGLVLNLTTGKSTEITTERPGRVTSIRWSPNGENGFVVSRTDDNEDEWVWGYSTKSDKLTMLWNEHCDAWVGGPARGTIGWYPDGSRIYFASESNGFANLYTISPEGGKPTPLVTGKFEVSDIRLDPERKRFTFVSSEGGPAIRHLDTINLDGTKKRKLADLSPDEDSDYAIAPNGEEVAVVKSKSNRPPELYVNNVQVTTTPSEEWLSGPWIDPPIVMIKAQDGIEVPARLYRPKKKAKGGPAVIFVHGAGYLQNVFTGWSHYFREYMFHHYLTSQGYTVLDMDYRGSAGYGRDWRTANYRHMGSKDLDDNVAGAKWLVDHEGVAKDRIGIYGGSYGGFITLMAMFTRPGVFAAGAALRPVTDWTTYNHGYTAPILNEPQTDPEAYKRSSPINFVDGLKGALLICHGVIDTNVPFQDSVRLAQKLIEAGKTDWELAPYPTENHAFTAPSSWADEYRRIYELFDRTIGSKYKKRTP